MVLIAMKFEDLTPAIGETLVNYSRKVLEEIIRNDKELASMDEPELVREKAGIFCTLRLNGQLRGCIGYPYPSHQLGEALVKATIQSATDDPRFNPVTVNELKDIELELTILTPPEIILVSKYQEYYDKIEIGKDGLIIERGNHRGLLLPQVPVEQRWDIDKYLQGICHKAYLPSDSWKEIDQVKLYKFQGVIFEEKK